MSRIYTVSFENVAVSAAQDLLQIKNGSSSGKVLRILRRWVGSTDTTIPTGQMLQLRESILTPGAGTVTDGSGGTTPSAIKRDQGDAAATFTAKANSTTPAAVSGGATKSTIYATGCHVFNGFDDIHDEPPTIVPGASYVFELLSTVIGTVHLSGGVEVEEIG